MDRIPCIYLSIYMILIYLPYISFYISCLPKVPLWYRNFVGTCVRIPQWMTLQLKRVRRWVARAYSEVDVLCHPTGQLINFDHGWLMFESWWCWSHAQNCYVVVFLRKLVSLLQNPLIFWWGFTGKLTLTCILPQMFISLAIISEAWQAWQWDKILLLSQVIGGSDRWPQGESKTSPRDP